MSDSVTKVVQLEKIQKPALLVGILGLAACVFAYLQNPEVTLQSYFFGFIFWICLTLGCFGLTLLHHTVRGSWGLSVLRIFEAGGGPVAFLFMVALFVPILLGMPLLYEWTHPEIVKNDPVLLHKSSYLNSTGFIIRTLFYFGIWILLSYILRKSTLREDRTLDPSETAKRTNLSAPGLAVFVLTVNFAMTDWVMSVSPHWFSTIFGALFAVGQALAAMAFGTFIVTRFASYKPYSDIVTPSLTRDLGNLLFVFTLVWTYFALSQYLIIWSGNLPEFNTFYVARSKSYWLYLGAFNIIGQFAIPFFLLLAPRVKAIPKLLMGVAVWIFVMRFVELYWEVMPLFRLTPPQWTDFAALVGVGGLWLAMFAAQVKKAALIPAYDPRLQEVAEHA